MSDRERKSGVMMKNYDDVKIFRDNLYLSTIDENAEKLSKECELGLELCQFTTTTNLDGKYFSYWFESAFKCKLENSKSVFHAPFNEIYPSSIDPDMRKVAMDKLNRAFEICYNYLGVKKFVVHSGYVKNVYFKEWFVEKSVEFWKEFMLSKPRDFILCIENVFDETPDYLVEIINGICDERVGVCLDIGHANVANKDNVMRFCSVEDWVDKLGNRLYHVHMHNNFGVNDEHAELSDGNIDICKVLNKLIEISIEKKKNGKNPITFTLETRNTEKSLEYLSIKKI